MTLRSDGSIADFPADSETIRLKLFKAHDSCKVKKNFIQKLIRKNIKY